MDDMKRFAPPLVALCLAVAVGIFLQYTVLDGVDWQLPWDTASKQETKPDADTGVQDTTPEAATTNTGIPDGFRLIYAKTGDSTSAVLEPVGTSGGTAAGGSSDVSAEATTGAREDNRWIRALVWILLFGVTALLVIKIFRLVSENTKLAESTLDSALAAGKQVSFEPISPVVGAGAPYLDDPANAIDPSLRKAKKDRDEAAEKLSKISLSLKGPVEIAVSDVRVAYVVENATGLTIKWKVEPDDPNKLELVPTSSGDKFDLIAKAPGAYVLVATVEDRGVTAVWSFPLFVKAAAPAPAPAPVTIPYLGVGWGTIALTLFIVLITALLGLEGAIDSAVVSGILLAIVGFLFGANATGGKEEKSGG